MPGTTLNSNAGLKANDLEFYDRHHERPGLMGLMGPNPYLEYTGKVPMAGFYGAPTDAMGNPIASFTQAQQQHDAWNAANPAPAPVQERR